MGNVIGHLPEITRDSPEIIKVAALRQLDDMAIASHGIRE